jgi:hypothetical protein
MIAQSLELGGKGGDLTAIAASSSPPLVQAPHPSRGAAT